MKPAFSVSVGGVSVTGNLVDRLLQLEVTDQEGSQSDTVRIMVDDRDGMLGIPQRGSPISVAMGYRESGVRHMGMFTVDSVSVRGWPRQLEVSGKSMDFTKLMKEQRSKNYEEKTVQQICGEIASRHGLANNCTGSIANLKLTIGQLGVSDAHFLQNLADEHDVIFGVKDGQLTFKKKGENIQGFALIIHPGNVMEYDLSFQDRNSHKGGDADWWDRKSARRQRSKRYGSPRGGRTQSPATSRSSKVHQNGQREADDHAQSRVDSLGRAELHLRMTIVGDPSFRAEMILIVAGVRAGVDGAYRIKSVVHSLSGDGYKTSIEAEGI